MRIRGTIFTVAALLALIWSGEARAQATPYELNVHVGGLSLDDAEDTDVLIGARIMLQYPSGWGWGGNFDWVSADEDLDLYLYSFEIDHTFGRGSQLRPFVGGGIGAATAKISDAPEGVDDSDTNVLIPIAGGVKWLNQPSQPSWAIRGEIRDNIIFTDEGDDDGASATNNWEFSGGVSFFF